MYSLGRVEERDSLLRPPLRARRSISGIEAVAPLCFSLSGDASVVAEDASRGSHIRTAEGIVGHADAWRLGVDLPNRRASLNHNLPPSLDLRALLGRSLRITLLEEDDGAGPPSQTLTLCGAHGQVWLIARRGIVRGAVHRIGGTEIHAALSQRTEGPLVVGTRPLQGLAYPGGRVRIPVARGDVVVELLSRASSDSAAYVIADPSLLSI